MKICIWTSKIFSLGGTKRVVTVLANELVKEHDVTIMVYQDRFKENRNMYHMSEEIDVDFIDNNDFVNRHWTPASWFRDTVVNLNEKHGIFNRPCFNHLLANCMYPVKTQKKWIEYLNQQDYDVIIATGAISLRLAILAPYLKAKTVGWQHNCYSGYLEVPGIAFWKQECLLQEYLPKLNKYIVLSEYDQRDYKEKLGIETEVKINPRSFVSEEKCDPSAKRFFMATRFVYAKGLDLMMEAFEEFCRQDEEWELDIIGIGELQEEIQEDAKKRHIDHRIHFVGYSIEPEKYYLGSSVFLLPSRWEGWPMVIMEAFEFGLPVIAFHTGAMDLIIDDGKTGFLPEAFDTKKFAQAMLTLAHDEKLRREMSENAIRKSADFAVEKTVLHWNDLFHRLTGYETFYEKNKKRICKYEEKYPLRASYAGYVRECPIEEKTILYEAFGGRGMICNPYALFRYLMRQEKYRDYHHIWVIDDFDDNKKKMEEYADCPNVKFVKFKTKEYCKALATSKYLINNVSFPSYFLKREGQVYLNTWHGTPMKNMGFDIPGANVTQGNTAKNLLSADYILSSGPYMTDIAYRKSYKLQNLYDGTVLESGFPRNDVLFHCDRGEIIERLKQHGVNVEENKKIILYAPTWKGDKYSDPDTGVQEFYEVIHAAEKSMNTEEYQILVKPHQIVYHYMKKNQIDVGGEINRFIPAVMDTNEILAVTDVLISDYSSIFYDFLATGRPMLFYVPDIGEFEQYRGLYFGVDRLPGPAVSTAQELGAFIGDIEGSVLPYKDRLAEMQKTICPRDDGSVCQRVAETVFDGCPEKNAVSLKNNEKPRLLVYAGTLSEKERLAFKEFLDKTDLEKYDVTLIGDGADQEETAEFLNGLPEQIRVLYWKPSYPATGEEYVRYLDFMKEGETVPEELKGFFRREARRMTGGSRFDYAVTLTDHKKIFQVISDCLEMKEVLGKDSIIQEKRML